jgi:8-oxo-dGTP pyrophosphatase MutT (NUDIX family)
MLKDLLRNWSPNRTSSDLPRQVGAMPWTLVEGRLVFLLITSRQSGRWIFPKGGLSGSLGPAESAAREALEEAGVEGEVARAPIGSYRTALSDSVRSLVVVDLYPLQVTTQLEEWPEMAERHRHWALLPEARRLLARRGPAVLVERFSRQMISSSSGR